MARSVSESGAGPFVFEVRFFAFTSFLYRLWMPFRVAKRGVPILALFARVGFLTFISLLAAGFRGCRLSSFARFTSARCHIEEQSDEESLFGSCSSGLQTRGFSSTNSVRRRFHLRCSFVSEKNQSRSTVASGGCRILRGLRVRIFVFLFSSTSTRCHSTLQLHFRLHRLVVIHSFHLKPKQLPEPALELREIREHPQILRGH